MSWHYLSTTRMTVAVRTTGPTQRITTAPPIVRRFLNQPLSNLQRWLRRQPGYTHHSHP